jgi:hypothetical protein
METPKMEYLAQERNIDKDNTYFKTRKILLQTINKTQDLEMAWAKK